MDDAKLAEMAARFEAEKARMEANLAATIAAGETAIGAAVREYRATHAANVATRALLVALHGTRHLADDEGVPASEALAMMLAGYAGATPDPAGSIARVAASAEAYLARKKAAG